MHSLLVTIASIIGLARVAFPQPAFEVATIKPVDTANGVYNAGVSVYPGGRIILHAVSLKNLIVIAWDVDYWQLSGGEDWMGKTAYDVEAKPAEQSGPYIRAHTRFGIGDERIRLMLRTLVTERFRLKLRRETKTGTVYLLEKSGKPFLPTVKKGPEDEASSEPRLFYGSVEHVGGHWFLFNTSLPQLARFAGQNVLHKPVIDKTGLAGTFHYRDRDAMVDQDNGDPEGSFLGFVRDIGLRLTSSTGPVETVVIEHAEKPSAN